MEKALRAIVIDYDEIYIMFYYNYVCHFFLWRMAFDVIMRWEKVSRGSKKFLWEFENDCEKNFKQGVFLRNFINKIQRNRNLNIGTMRNLKHFLVRNKVEMEQKIK